MSVTDDSAGAAHGGSGADPVLLGTTSVTHSVQEGVLPGGVNEGVVLGGGSDVEILDSKLASSAHKAARARRLGYEQNRQWQDIWAVRLPWAESVFGEDGKIRQVHYKICSDVEGKDKLLVSKLDSLYKHCGRHKAKTSFGKVVVGKHYFLSNNVHV